MEYEMHKNLTNGSNFRNKLFFVGENDGGTNKLFTNHINGFQKFKEFFSNFLIILHTYTKKT